MKDIKSVCSMDNLDFASYCCDFSSDGKLLSYGCADKDSFNKHKLKK